MVWFKQIGSEELALYVFSEDGEDSIDDLKKWQVLILTKKVFDFTGKIIFISM